MNDVSRLPHAVPPTAWMVSYTDIPGGVLITDAAGAVVFSNDAADAIFAPLRPVSFGLRSLLGLAGVTGAGELMRQVEAREPSGAERVGLPDGRTLDARTRPHTQGGAIVTLFDITSHVQGAGSAALDALTGLALRAGLQKHLRECLLRRQSGNGSVAVIFLDLDKFKMVNDTLGHPVGDALLAKVAERLRSAVRADDLIGRLGGDEFVVVQNGGTRVQAERLASRLVDLIGRTYIAAGHMVTVGASIGIAIAPDDGDDVESLLKHADLALYRAKMDGRGTFRFFQSSMDAEMQVRRLLEIDLRKALALKQLELFYQPQVDIETKTLIGFEALIRWRSPTRGLVSPAVFIPLAEEIGLITRIGDWVLRTACRTAAGWASAVSVSVNVSPAQFLGNKLVASVQAALAASGLDPARLELEITEGSLLDNTASVLQTLRELRAMGVRIAMDDFGTGYSSLSYLQKFPFDKIKIDQAFVRNTDRNFEAGAIVRAISALGRTLGMKTIAEGVETPEQLARVRAEGCSEVQGYLTGRPLPAEEAAAMMAVVSSSE